MGKILLCDDQELMRDSLAATLSRMGHEVVSAHDGTVAVQRLSQGKYDLLITDLKMPKMGGIELLGEVKKMKPELPVVLMTAFASVQTAVEAMKLGAYDYIQKPFDGEEIRLLVERTLEHARLRQENAALRVAAEGGWGGGTSGGGGRQMVGSGPAMSRIRQTLQRVAQSSATVLIRGESGTGKEVVARAIHAMSDRRDRPFLAVNCAALSENLLESELFGHEKGAFTGADKLRKGRFELADGGTLLLDEISEIAPGLQAKLLRVLQESAFERVGSSMTQQVDVRVIATSNRHLEAEVEAGKFRQDLYYRLSVVPVELPPLRQRKEDIGELSAHFLEQLGKRYGKKPRTLDARAMELLMGYDWPGNVRELSNIIERACVLETDEDVIHGQTIEPWLMSRVRGSGAGAMPAEDVISQGQEHEVGLTRNGFGERLGGLVHHGSASSSGAGSDGVATAKADGLVGGGGGGLKPLAEVEKEVILSALTQFKGHRVKTATALGIGVRTLGMKLKKWREEGVEVD